MKYKIVLFFLSFQLITSQVDYEKLKELSIDYSVRGVLNYDDDFINVISFLDKSISTKTEDEIRSFWLESDTTPISKPYSDFWMTVNGNGYYKPTLLSLTRLSSNEFTARIALIGQPEKFNSLNFIYNVKVVKVGSTFKLKGYLNDNIKAMPFFSKNNISFFNANPYPNDEINSQFEFDKFYSILINKPKIDYKIVVCSGFLEIEKLRGYDYSMEMYWNNDLGGLAYPKDKIFFTGNGKAYHSHETVHIYNHHYFNGLHPVIDEGTAVYFGGSHEKDYQIHKNTLREFLITNNFSVKANIFDELNKLHIIDDYTSFYYSISAFFVDLVYKKRGSEGVIELLKTPKDDGILIKKLESLLEFKWNEVDEFVMKEIKK